MTKDERRSRVVSSEADPPNFMHYALTEKHFVQINLNSLIYLHDKIVWVVSPLWRLTFLSAATEK